MRKGISAFMSIALLFVFTIAPFSAYASVDYLSVPASYAIWAKYVYEEDTDDDIRTSRSADGLTVTSMDKIATYTNPENLAVERLSLLFYDNNITYTDAQLNTIEGKALAFFSAIEGGNFLILSKEEAGAASEKAAEIYYGHVLVLTDEQYEQIWNGFYLPFYTSDAGTYYMHYEYGSRYMIYFVPDGQKALDDPDRNPTKTTADILSELLSESESWQSRFRSETESRMKEYYDTTLDNFTLTLTAGADSVQAMNIYFTWAAKNGEDMTKRMLEMFSDDLAATLHNFQPDMPILQLTIFWKVPYITQTGYAAKYQYASRDAEIYRQKELGVLYGKE